MKICFTPSLRALARRRELLALADVGGEGHDLAAVGLPQPLKDDGGVETAGISQYDFFYLGHRK